MADPAQTFTPYAPGLFVPSPKQALSGYAMPASPGANTKNLNPVFADRVQDLQQDAQDNGIASTLISGFRDNALQAELRARYLAGTGGMAAPAGQSYHNTGNAADIITVDPKQQSALTALAAEPWRGITPGATFGDYDHYQIAGPMPQGVPDFSGVAPPAPAQTASASPGLAAAPAAAPAAQSRPSPPAGPNWGALFANIAPAPAAPPQPQQTLTPQTPPDPAAIARMLVAGLPKNLILADS